MFLLGSLWLPGWPSTALTATTLARQFEELDRQLTAAEQVLVPLLAPETFSEARKHYQRARKAWQRGRTQRALDALDKSGDLLTQARSKAELSRDIMARVIEARNRAVRAQAMEYFPKSVRDADAAFVKACRYIERGDTAEAKERRGRLEDRYTDLELAALKEGTTEAARLALQRAREHDAHRLSPRMFKKAQQAIDQAIATLEADRRHLTKAQGSARQGELLALRSYFIADQIKQFDAERFSEEDKLLWFQDQLASLAEVLGVETQFAEPATVTMKTFNQAAADLVEARRRLAVYERKIDELDEKSRAQLAQIQEEMSAQVAELERQYARELSLQESLTQELVRRQQAQENRFWRVQALFEDSEATVYRQRENVLISAHGFTFRPGSSHIDDSNFSLLSKIVLAITEFESARIEISGHTDATGNDQENLRLSEQRAKNVADFLVEVGGIERRLIQVKGYGAEKPVASNKTEQGRAQNRRIEVLIINENP